MSVITNPRNALLGDHVSFLYNNKQRKGVVEVVGNKFMKIKHDHPEHFNGKVYSSYSFRRLQSDVVLIN